MDTTRTFSRRSVLRLAAASLPVAAAVALPGIGRAATPTIELIDAVSASIDNGVRPPAGTAGTVRYEDLYRSGMSLQNVFDKAGASVSTSKQVILTFPADEFTFSNFTVNNVYGLRIPSNVGVAGSGRDGADATVFKMATRSSTRAPQIPQKGSGQLNPFYYIGIQNNGTVMPPTGIVLQNFAILGTEQGHLYHGLRIQNCNRPIIKNLYIEGIPGNMAAPPGETMGINIYKGQGAQFSNVEVDGRRTRQGGTESVGASPIGHNNHNDSLMTDCYFHHNYYGMPTYWQSSGNVTDRCRSEYNKTGFNHERCTDITHKNSRIILGGERPHHFTFMNDQYNGTLTVRNPSWDAGSANRSKMVVYNGARGTGVVDMQTSMPVVTGGSGESIMSQVLVAGN